MAGSKKIVYKYCPLCASRMVTQKIGAEAVRVCPKCDFKFWDNPKPVVSIVIHKDAKILLLRRAKQPFKGAWCLPGGFIKWGEDADEAVVRECKEEAGVKPRVGSIVGVYKIDSDPRGMHLDIIFEGKAEGQISLSEEHDDYGFFPVTELPTWIEYKHREAIKDWAGSWNSITQRQ